MEDLIQTNYAIDTFYFLVMGVLVMFMACGFSMLESGMVRAKNTAEILTKNVALYSIACIMYLLVGYHIMYVGGTDAGGIFPSFGFLLQPENTAEAVVASDGETYYSARSDYFFQVVFVATAMSIVSGAVAERMKLWAFLILRRADRIDLPVARVWTWGGGLWLPDSGYSIRGIRNRGTCAAPRRRWQGCSCLDRAPASTARMDASTRSRAATCRWPRSGCSCCGLDGLVSTAVPS